MVRPPTRIGVVLWTFRDELAEQNAAVLGTLGYTPVPFLAADPLPPDLAAILVGGPFGSMVPLGRRLLAIPVSTRPKLVWHITEQLPDPRFPAWFVLASGRLRAGIERAGYRLGEGDRIDLHPWLKPLAPHAHRFRYVGDLDWLRRTGVLTTLVTGSPWRARRFKAAKFPVQLTISPEFYPGWGQDLRLERDVPVLWIGKPGSRRRVKLLAQLRADLGERGVPLLMVDGHERPYLFGLERTKLLNRTRIVVNFVREPWDNNAMRFALAAANGALIVSEPMLDHTNFIAGEHLVVASPDQMADRILDYLQDEPARLRIVERAYRKLQENSREKALKSVFDNVIT